jgi:Mg2+/citrate symporter
MSSHPRFVFSFLFFFLPSMRWWSLLHFCASTSLSKREKKKKKKKKSWRKKKRSRSCNELSSSSSSSSPFLFFFNAVVECGECLCISNLFCSIHDPQKVEFVAEFKFFVFFKLFLLDVQKKEGKSRQSLPRVCVYIHNTLTEREREREREREEQRGGKEEGR